MENSLETKSNNRHTTVPVFFSVLFKLYCTSILVLLALRIFELYYAKDPSIPWTDTLTYISLFIGMQFDSVVLSYIFLLPLLLLFVQQLIGKSSRLLLDFLKHYISLLLTAIFVLAIADIPYFTFFHNRLSEASLQWLESWKIVLQMIIENKSNLFFLVLVLLVIPITYALCFRFLKREFAKIESTKNQNSLRSLILYFLLASLLCFIGLRGKLAHPIRLGDASYCHSPLLNQLGLNPAYCILKSYTEKVRLMDPELAINLTHQHLQIDAPIDNISPIARQIKMDSIGKKYNVVVVLMESMSAHYMQYFGNTQNLTPNLDSLIPKSLFFKNAFSAGIHTNNGIFSTLYSFPALKRIRPMNTIPIRKYSGLPYVTKQQGYTNLFFSCHSFVFDNIDNFIPENNFDKIYSSEVFPPEKSLSAFGVPDNYLFNYAIDTFDQMDTSKPFFATLLTASNHEPYVLPNDFQSAQTQPNLRATNYADWSIGQFLARAKKSAWFKKTIFIFVADHGFRVGENKYDLELSYQHVPIIFYAPSIIPAKVSDAWIGQIDIFPTLMGMLHFPYINNTLGTDIIKQPRECIYFSADDKIGCINAEWLYVYRFTGEESLYHYQNGDLHNFINENKTMAAQLRDYAFSQIQTAEWMYSNDKTRISKE